MKDRKSNIEFLRCIAIFFVIMLHYNSAGMGGGFQYVKEGTFNYYFMYFMEALAVCAVDIFILISGFFSSQSFSRKTGKPLMLLFTCIFYRELIYITESLLNGQRPGLSGLLGGLIPSNYFIILYVAVYFMSLYLNVLIDHLEDRECRIFLAVSTILLVVWENIWDIFQSITGKEIVGISFVGAWGNQEGYTLVNFLFLYMCGAYIRRYRELFKKQKYYYGAAYLAVSVVIFGSSLITTAVWNYNNILVILQAVFLFLFFLKTEAGVKPGINRIAGTVFGVYLMQGAMYRFFDIKQFVNQAPWKMMIHFAATTMIIFVICTVCAQLLDIILKKMEKIFKRIPLFQYEITVKRKAGVK